MTDTAGQTENSGQGEPKEAPAARRASPRARRVLLGVLGAVVVLGGGWFYYYESYGRYQQSTNDAYLQSDAITVAPKVGGYVEKLFVRENQAVRAGDPLVQIDPRDYRAQTAQFAAQMGVAEATAEGIRAQISEQDAAIEQARAQLAQAQAASYFAQGEAARYAPLAATGAETREKLSDLRSKAQQAAAQVRSAQAALVNAQRRVATLRAQVGQARSQGEAARAQMAAARVNLESTVLRAPADGRVGSKSVEPGQFVQPGLRLMSIVPVRTIYIEANFKETQLGLMRVGQPVAIEVDALEGVTLHGHVDSIAPGTGAQFSLLPPQNATGNFTKIVQRVPVRIAIEAGPETRKLLVPGMSVVVSVDTRSARGTRAMIEREEREQKARAKGSR